MFKSFRFGHSKGTKKVKAAQGGSNPVRRTAIHGEYGGHQSVGRSQSYCDYADKDGNESVANWICEPGCPVARLDANSLAGGMHSAGSSRSAKREAGKTGMFPMDGDGHRFGDSGGASRFYKQVGGSGEKP